MLISFSYLHPQCTGLYGGGGVHAPSDVVPRWFFSNRGGLDMATGTKRQEQGPGRQRPEGSEQSAQSPLANGIKDGLTGPEAPVNGREFGADGRQNALKKYVDEEQLARGLGWFSLGLGLAELLAPRGVAKVAGLRGNTGLIR